MINVEKKKLDFRSDKFLNLLGVLYFSDSSKNAKWRYVIVF